jgi:dienelactone hydrolase
MVRSGTAIALFLTACSDPEPSTSLPSTEGFVQQVSYESDGLTLQGYLCKPEGAGPFPGVQYNHGGSGAEIGGPPEETCRELMETGYVAFSPIRREDTSEQGNLHDVQAALDYLKGLSYVDSSRIGIIGFSRGGSVTFTVATESEGFEAIVLMATGIGLSPDIEAEAAEISAPVLLLVAENDTPTEINGNQDMVESMTQLEEALKAAGKEVTLIIYPAFEPHGHEMFFSIGDYMTDVENFLARHL